MSRFNLADLPPHYQQQIANQFRERRAAPKPVEKESELQREANQYLAQLRDSCRIIDYQHMRKAKGNRKGIPDLLIFMPKNKIIYIELKSRKGKLTKEQKQFKERCEMLETKFNLCQNIEEVITAVTEEENVNNL